VLGLAVSFFTIRQVSLWIRISVFRALTILWANQRATKEIDDTKKAATIARGGFWIKSTLHQKRDLVFRAGFLLVRT